MQDEQIHEHAKYLAEMTQQKAFSEELGKHDSGVRKAMQRMFPGYQWKQLNAEQRYQLAYYFLIQDTGVRVEYDIVKNLDSVKRSGTMMIDMVEKGLGQIAQQGDFVEFLRKIVPQKTLEDIAAAALQDNAQKQKPFDRAETALGATQNAELKPQYEDEEDQEDD